MKLFPPTTPLFTNNFLSPHYLNYPQQRNNPLFTVGYGVADLSLLRNAFNTFNPEKLGVADTVATLRIHFSIPQLQKS